MFDTDGYCGIDKNISLSSATKNLIEECKNDLEKLNIYGKIHFGKSNSYQLHIYNKSYKKFALEIGFSHPRKKMNMLFNLKKGNSDRYFNGLKKGVLYKKMLNIKKVDNLFLHSLNYIIKDFRKKNKLKVLDLVKKIGIGEKNIYILENSSSIKIKYFVKFLNLFGYDYEKILKFLYKNKSIFSSYGHNKSKIHLPLKLNNNYKFIFSNLRPYNYEVRIVKRDLKDIDKFLSLVQKRLNVKIIERRKGVFSIRNEALSKYLLTFFEYKLYWNKLSEDEIFNINKNLNRMFN